MRPRSFLNQSFGRHAPQLLLLAVLAVGGYLLVTFGIVPVASHGKKHAAQMIAQREVLARLDAEAKQVPALQSQFSSLTQKIRAQLPADREESQFLSAIGEVAGETNVLISSMNPLPLHDVGAFKELSVEIDMEANLGNVVRFLYLMRKASVVLVANRLWLQPKEERSALLKGHLVISTIFLKEK